MLPEKYIVKVKTNEEFHIVRKYLKSWEDHGWFNPFPVSNTYFIGFKDDGDEFYNATNYYSNPILTFKEWKEMKEETEFPKKWQIQVTKENKIVLGNWRKHGQLSSGCFGWVNSEEGFWNDCEFDSSYTKITFEQFQKYVLKNDIKMYSIKELEENEKLVIYIDSQEEFNQLSKITTYLTRQYYGQHCYRFNYSSYSSSSNKNYAGSFEDVTIVYLNQIKELQENPMQKLIISIQEALEIHKIACSTWKSKIANYLTRVDSEQNITFTQTEVDEMFKAATTEQKPVLERIFGKKVEIDWNKIKTGSKVMIKDTDAICSGNWDKTKPVDVVFYKTKQLITGGNIFRKESVSDKYCTFYQDGNFILFSADNSTDYITEVIEYGM